MNAPATTPDTAGEVESAAALADDRPASPSSRRPAPAVRWLGQTLMAGSLGALGAALAAAAPLPAHVPSDVVAAGIARGTVIRLHFSNGRTRADYLAYLPRGAGTDAPILVTVHGISRNAREHLKEFAPLAERYGVVLIAPEYTPARFPGYQRLLADADGVRPDQLLLEIVADVRQRAGARGAVHLFGFSGGGQFVHRFVMAHPEAVRSYVVGAAGWYTFPDPAQRFPFGLRRNRALDVGGFDAARFLAVPGAVLVGERDRQRGTAMRDTARVTDQQGRSRYERGRNWVDAMRRAASEQGLVPQVSFESLPRSPHSFARSVRRGGLGERVFRHLFGEPPCAATGGNSESPETVPTCIVPS